MEYGTNTTHFILQSSSSVKFTYIIVGNEVIPGPLATRDWRHAKLRCGIDQLIWHTVPVMKTDPIYNTFNSVVIYIPKTASSSSFKICITEYCGSNYNNIGKWK